MGATRLQPTETTVRRDSVREASPAAAVGSMPQADPSWWCARPGPTWPSMPVAADTRPGSTRRPGWCWAVPERDRIPTLDRPCRRPGVTGGGRPSRRRGSSRDRRSLLARAAGLERELADTEARLADPEVVRTTAASPRCRAGTGRFSRWSRPVALRTAADDLAAAEELLASSSGDEREGGGPRPPQHRRSIERLEQELRVLLLRDPNDDDVIVELRGPRGGRPTSSPGT